MNRAASSRSQSRRSSGSSDGIGSGTASPLLTDPDPHRNRAGSGSFNGAYESEEDIVAFAGMRDRVKSLHDSLNSAPLDVDAAPRDGQNPEEEKLKRKLKFFFMNPKDKYLATRQIPWKLLLQIIKVLVVTTQLWVFATFRYAHVNYYSDQTVAFEHFFIKDWDQVREVYAYPPSTGKLALYKKQEFYDFVDFAIDNYRRIEEEPLGPFFRNSSVKFCIQHFKVANITRDLLVEVDTKLVDRCLELKEEEVDLFNTTAQWFDTHNFAIPWKGIQYMDLRFNLTSVTLKPLGPLPSPDCFQFKVFIRLFNAGHDGQMPIQLEMTPVRLDCPSHDSRYYSQEGKNYSMVVVLLNLVVVFICISSLILCLRALLRAQILKHETDAFFYKNFGWSLTINEKMEFLNLWYVMICVNDCLIILGSIIKQLIESKSIIGDMWDICSLLLGTGSLLVWFGLLRYLGFFKTYNVLILTMKGAAPNMLRFLICASFIYIGFVFAGWLILGPYHFKFETIMSTSECLFSLINGDDMFATFKSIPIERAFSVWVYSRVYLYTFICLFIYVVLSLFISIIMDTYELIKGYYQRGFPVSRLTQFYSTCDFDFTQGQYQTESIFERVWTIIRNSMNSRSRGAYEEIN